MIDHSKIHLLTFADGHKRQIKLSSDGTTKGYGATWKLINDIVYVFDANRFVIGEFNNINIKDTIIVEPIIKKELVSLIQISVHPIEKAEWGIDGNYIDVTEKARKLFDINGCIDANTKNFGDPIPGKWKHLLINNQKTLENSYYSNTKLEDIVKKLNKFNIKEEQVYEYIKTLDNNTDMFEDHILLTIINHTKKCGIVISKPYTWPGLYCFVNYYNKKINDVINIYKYKLDKIFALDGFTSYKDEDDTNVYTELFKYNESGITLLEKYFSPTNEIINNIKKIKIDLNINLNKTIAVYYRGSDKSLETKLPDINKFFKSIDILLKDDMNILFQTDQKQILDAAKNKYGKKLYYLDYIPVTYQNKLGTHHLQTENRIKTAMDFNSILRIISECKYMIISDRSNVSRYLRDITVDKSKIININ